MKKRNAFVASALAALAVAGGYLAFQAQEPAVHSSLAQVSHATAATGPSEAEAPAPASSSITPRPRVVSPAPAPAGVYDPEQDDGTIAFEADARGDLVTNEKARLDVERLYALYTPAERERKLQEATATLPPAAAQQLRQLMEQYQNYQAAVRQTYPPDREMTAVEQGAAQIDGMHGLRVQFFGEQAAKGMFGDEERTQRQLFALMENEKDPGLTMEEKAERAQRIYSEQRAN
jgi:hypothetical protein